jgi:drug/metabolite transporter (DMT)-like permease
MLAVVLALGSSLCWGVGDLLAGLAARRGAARLVTLTGQLVGLAGAAAVVGLLGRPFPGWIALAPALLAGLALAVGTVAYFAALAGGTMSIVAPIAATSAVVPVTFGLFQGERPSSYQFLGALLALSGVALASREPRSVLPTIEGPITLEQEQPRLRPPAPGRGAGATAGLALLAAACFGFVLVGFAQAAKHDPFWTPLGARMSSVLVLTVALAGGRSARMLPAGALAFAAAAGLLHVTAATFFSLASTRGYLSVVAVLSSLSAVVMVALAFALLHERLDRARALGVLAALVGVVILVAG